jgi:hypothetical protein
MITSGAPPTWCLTLRPLSRIGFCRNYHVGEYTNTQIHPLSSASTPLAASNPATLIGYNLSCHVMSCYDNLIDDDMARGLMLQIRE